MTCQCGFGYDTSLFDPQFPENPVLAYYEHVAGFTGLQASSLAVMAADSAGPNLGYGGDPIYFKHLVANGGDMVQALIDAITEIAPNVNYQVPSTQDCLEADAAMLASAGPANIALLNSYLSDNPFNGFMLPPSLCPAVAQNPLLWGGFSQWCPGPQSNANRYQPGPYTPPAQVQIAPTLYNALTTTSAPTPVSGPSTPTPPPITMPSPVSTPVSTPAAAAPSLLSLPSLQVNQPQPQVSEVSMPSVSPAPSSSDWFSSLTSSFTSAQPVATVGGISLTAPVLIGLAILGYFLLKD